MTHTTRRRTLVPRSAIIAAIVVLLLAIAAAAASVLVAGSRLVEVPDVEGLPTDAAEARLQATGLTLTVDGSRVSPTVDAGDVLTQEPAAGARVRTGETVTVVLSAGPQTVIVPDLIGRTSDAATDVLVSLGLEATQVAMSSESTPGVVLEMFPAPGAAVNVGDNVRMSVSGEPSTSDALLPYDLKGLSVLIDPQPAPGAITADAPMEIARRLQSLLEAAGATVSTTRTGVDAPSPAERQERAATSSATLFVGIDLGSDGTPGVRAMVPSPESGTERETRSRAYATAITRAANLPGILVNEPGVTTDPVLAAFPGPGVRVLVGDATVESDRARFGDPAWADQVARALYRGLGTTPR